MLFLAKPITFTIQFFFDAVGKILNAYQQAKQYEVLKKKKVIVMLPRSMFLSAGYVYFRICILRKTSVFHFELKVCSV